MEAAKARPRSPRADNEAARAAKLYQLLMSTQARGMFVLLSFLQNPSLVAFDFALIRRVREGMFELGCQNHCPCAGRFLRVLYTLI